MERMCIAFSKNKVYEDYEIYNELIEKIKNNNLNIDRNYLIEI